MSIKLLKKIHCTVETLTGYTFFIAGGAVVDTLYGKEPKDYDMVLPFGMADEVEAHALIEELSSTFARFGFSTKVYQSYGLNMGEEVNDTEFQSMFFSCMKVQMGSCQLDILLSKHHDIISHVKHHDCNMNMVWFDGRAIQWEHGGVEAKVDCLEFREGVSDERINRMDIKRHALHQLNSDSPFI